MAVFPDNSREGSSGADSLTGTSGRDYFDGRSGDDTLTGYAGNDTLIGGDDNDCIIGGAGDDSLTGGNGSDIFVFGANEGKDVITDYISGEDILQFTSGKPKFKVNGNDVVITVGSGKITVKGAADRLITYIDKDGKERTWPDDIEIDEDTNTVKLLTGYARDTFKLAGYADDIQTVDASAVQQDLEITGTSKANKIIGSGEEDVIDGGKGKDTLDGGDGNDILLGGAGNDSLYGGDGNDTLTGGAGSDIFVYASGTGKDVVTDYNEEDKIRFTSGTKDEIEIFAEGNDAVLQFDANNQITLKDVAGKTITYIVGGKEYTTIIGEAVKYNNKGTAATLTENYSDEEFKFSASKYPKKLATLNAASVAHDLSITGNSLANSIIGTEEDDTIDGGKGKDTINGGDGNDVIIGGKGNDYLSGGDGEDVFVYSNGDGNDLITDYANEDMISIASGKVSNAKLSGDNYILTVGSGKITIKGVENKFLHVFDSTGETWYPYPPVPPVISSKGITLTTGFFDDSIDINTYTDAARFKNTIVTIDASAADHGLSITGNKIANRIIGTEDDDTINGGAGKDTIDGGDGNDSILGGTGNDILTGGEGADVFVYRNGDGNDKILDYSEEDVIQFTSGKATAKTVGNDVVFTLGKGKITVVGGKEHVISYEDASGLKTYPANPLTINKAGTAVTLKSTYRATTFDLTTNAYIAAAEISDIVKNIDGSKVTHDLEIIGNGKANKITGSAEDDTIYGGAGNDTLKGGKGEDVFVFGADEDKDVITDYTSGEDIISIMSGATASVGKSGDNVVFKVGKGTITVKNVKDQVISYYENDELKTYPTVDAYTISKDGKTVTLSESYTTYYGDTFDVSSQEDTKNVIKIDATEVDADLVVKGNNKNNVINCSGGDNTIYGGKGGDTINGGDGSNLYVYKNGDGNDKIVRWGDGDTFSIVSGSVSKLTVKKGTDTVIMTVGNGKISLQGAADKDIAWYDDDSDGRLNHTMLGSSAYDNVLESDNFITGNDLGSIVEYKAADYSVVQAGSVTSLIKGNNALPVLSPSKKK